MFQALLRWKRAFFSRLRLDALDREVRSFLYYLRSVERVCAPEPPKFERALILAPHPDDEVIGCGGTIRHIVTNGGRVDVAFFTCGERNSAEGMALDSSVMAARKEERSRRARLAANMLGITDQYFLDRGDGDLFRRTDLSSEISHLMERAAYDVIFCPWPFDSHADHIATFRGLQAALRKAPRNLQIWLYEVWSPLPANRIVGIDRYIDDKCKAIDVYTAENEPNDYPGKFRGLASYRALSLPHMRYAEAFLAGDREFVLSLLREHAPTKQTVPASARRLAG